MNEKSETNIITMERVNAKRKRKPDEKKKDEQKINLKKNWSFVLKLYISRIQIFLAFRLIINCIM